MPWVELSEQDKITATLVDHGNPWNPGHTIRLSGSVVIPDGGMARFNGWEIQLSKPCLVAFSSYADGTTKHASMNFDEAGFSAGDLSQNWVVQDNFVILDNGANPSTWGPVQVSSIETDLVVHTPPEWLGEGTPSYLNASGYNLVILIWEEEEEEPIEDSGAFATVRITVLGEDTIPDTCPKNWWLCCPKPDPDPVPERPTGFVPLDQYDLEFTYPLKSSRKPSRNPLQDGCVNCGPVFVTPAPPVPEPDPDPEPEPEPEVCAEVLFISDWYDNYITAFPESWSPKIDHFYNLTFSNKTYEERGDPDTWTIQIEIDWYGEDDYSLYRSDVTGYPPYGPFDGEPNTVQGYVWYYTDEGILVESCAVIHLQEAWPS